MQAVLAGHDLADPAGARAATRAIQGILADLAVPRQVARLLQQALPALAGDGTPLAVRSSATTEDADEASY